MTTDDWDDRLAAAWTAVPQLSDDDALEAIDALVTEKGGQDAAAAFEAASVRDYLGLEPEAEPFYRRALELGLDGIRHPQAVIQLASTLRNLGEYDESIDLLTDWLADNEDHPLEDAAKAFLALALTSAGRPVEAVAVALDALAPRLPQYGRSVAAYAEQLE
jgi:tetratricopeptide (TPR) repeat protein